MTSINTGDEEDEGDDDALASVTAVKTTYSAPKRFIEEAARHAKVSYYFFCRLLDQWLLFRKFIVKMLWF